MRPSTAVDATIVADIEVGLWSIKVDPSQLNNVILNLAINARDAMADGGTLTIRAANVPKGSPRLSDLANSDYVMIEIADTGCGMPEAVRKRAFEPFFTTKPTGQGTGLGLSMAYGFIKQSGGEIVIDSETGRGTSVKIFLMRSLADADIADEHPAAPLFGGLETILVVEDEEDVRSSTVELLSALGYQVFEAADATRAVELIEAGTNIDLVFSDVIMPGELSSLELSKVVRAKLPSAQILFTSGYAEGVLAHDGRLDAGVNLLQKPYNADTLSARIRHLLRRRKPVAAASI